MYCFNTIIAYEILLMRNRFCYTIIFALFYKHYFFFVPVTITEISKYVSMLLPEDRFWK